MKKKKYHLSRRAGERGRFVSVKANNLSRDLGRSEMIEFYKGLVSASTPQKELWRDAMDIDRPDIEVVSRNITEAKVQEFFRMYDDAVIDGLQNAQGVIDFYKDKIYSGQEKMRDGRCVLRRNQPLDGY